jgi:hypothetical protein
MSKVMELTVLPLTFGFCRTQTKLLGEEAGMANFMEQSHAWEANGHAVKKSPPFIDPKDSLPHSQDPTTGIHLEPYVWSPDSHILFL